MSGAGFIEVIPAAGTVDRRFVAVATITDLESSASGGGTYHVQVRGSFGNVRVVDGLTSVEADEKVEEIAMAIGLDWRNL